MTEVSCCDKTDHGSQYISSLAIYRVYQPLSQPHMISLQWWKGGVPIMHLFILPFVPNLEL